MIVCGIVCATSDATGGAIGGVRGGVITDGTVCGKASLPRFAFG